MRRGPGRRLKRRLYDTYKMAIRWASDRIGDKGVIAFVSNGSWIDGNEDAGVRACLVEEFSSIWVLNLRGNQRTQGERSRKEGGKVFGSGSRAPVAITLLVRNPNSSHEGCRILYRDIGDYLKREEKLEILRDAGTIAGFDDWREITPDEHHDWIGQRNKAYQELYALGSKAAKAGKPDETIFQLYSLGFATNRDAYIYNYSHDACAETARKMVGDYMAALRDLESSDSADASVDQVTRRHSSHVRWDQNLRDNARRGKTTAYSLDNVWATQYRPFVKQHCYVDYTLAARKYQQDWIFPLSSINARRVLTRRDEESRHLRAGHRLDQTLLGPHGRHDAGLGAGVEGPVLTAVPVRAENRAICVPGVGATKPFSVLVTDRMPDLHFLEFGQCLPRWVYPRPRGYL